MRIILLSLLLFFSPCFDNPAQQCENEPNNPNNFGTVVLREGDVFEGSVFIFDADKAQSLDGNESGWGGLVRLEQPLFVEPNTIHFVPVDYNDYQRWTTGPNETRPNHTIMRITYRPTKSGYFQLRIDIIDMNNIRRLDALYFYVAEQQPPSLLF